MKVHAAALAIMLPAAAQAAVWSSGTDRGVPFYSLNSQGLSLTIACDPDDVYQPPQNYIQLSVSGRPVDGSATISSGNNSVTLPFEAGTAFKEAVSPEAWEKAITILGARPEFVFEDQKIAVKIEPSYQLTSDCK